jgi:hypothetical protein
VPVPTGSKAGIGLVILLDQISKLLGLHVTKQSFFVDLAQVVDHGPDLSLPTLVVASSERVREGRGLGEVQNGGDLRHAHAGVSQ